MEADVVHGQKTGHFLDQRDNRTLVRSMAAGASVLERDGDRVRLVLRNGTELGDVVRLAETAGPVSHFAFEPPNLSEVFREAVAQ